jgi:hypothetical protein
VQIAWGLAALGAIHVVLLLLQLGPLHGSAWSWLANTPHKALFHVVLLPVASSLLIRCGLEGGFPAALRRSGLTALGLFVVLGLCALGVAYSAENASTRTARPETPYDVGPPDSSLALAVWHHRLWDAVLSPRALSPDTARTKYVERVRQMRAGSARATWTSKWDDALTIVGGLGVAFVLWYPMVWLIAVRKPDARASDALALAIAVLILWVPATVYSDWYLCFGAVGLGQVPSVTTAAVVAGIGLSTVLLVLKNAQKVVRNGATISTFGTVIATIAGYAMARVWTALAQGAVGAWPVLLAIEIFLAIIIILGVRFLVLAAP